MKYGRVVYAGRQADLARLLAENKDSFVIKGATGNSSREIWIGRRLDSRQWQEAVELAFTSGNCIVQEYVESVPFLVRLWDVKNGQECERAVAGVLSPFLVDGTSAGCQLRFAPHELEKILCMTRAGVMFNAVAESR